MGLFEAEEMTNKEIITAIQTMTDRQLLRFIAIQQFEEINHRVTGSTKELIQSAKGV